MKVSLAVRFQGMRVIVIPRDRLLALERGAPGFLRALLTLEDDPDPKFFVVRSIDEGRFIWHLQVGEYLLPLDAKNPVAMAAAMPIFLVDLVHELQDELAEVFALAGMYEGIEKLIPFLRTFKKDMPS